MGLGRIVLAALFLLLALSQILLSRPQAGETVASWHFLIGLLNRFCAVAGLWQRGWPSDALCICSEIFFWRPRHFL